MHHPIQMKPADSENRNGKCFLSLFTSIGILCVFVTQFWFDGQ